MADSGTDIATQLAALQRQLGVPQNMRCVTGDLDPATMRAYIIRLKTKMEIEMADEAETEMEPRKVEFEGLKSIHNRILAAIQAIETGGVWYKTEPSRPFDMVIGIYKTGPSRGEFPISTAEGGSFNVGGKPLFVVTEGIMK